jgi:DNA-binding phage protein
MEINQIFPKVSERSVNVSQVAQAAGISRTTYYNILKNPQGTTLTRLKAIAAALGYKMIVTFEKVEITHALAAKERK